jgi:hypothetical protein
MKLRDLTELAARNLREAVLRNSLTTLGIAVGVASLVAMLSLGVGLQELASTRLSRSGLFDAVFVTTQATMRAFGGPPRPAANRAMTPRGSNWLGSRMWWKFIRRCGFRRRCSSRESRT